MHRETTLYARVCVRAPWEAGIHAAMGMCIIHRESKEEKNKEKNKEKSNNSVDNNIDNNNNNNNNNIDPVVVIILALYASS